MYEITFYPLVADYIQYDHQGYGDMNIYSGQALKKNTHQVFGENMVSKSDHTVDVLQLNGRMLGKLLDIDPDIMEELEDWRVGKS